MSVRDRPKRPIVLFWENFGPLHLDRIRATRVALKKYRLIGIQFFGESETYSWRVDESEYKDLRILNIFKTKKRRSWPAELMGLINIYREIGRGYYFLCHYEKVSVFIFSIILRILGNKVFHMNVSKFDDRKRVLLVEIIKKLALLPYCGGLGSAGRPIDYMRFLGLKNIHQQYNTVDIQRLYSQVEKSEIKKFDFHKKHFICIARLVNKKNIATLIDAYFEYIHRYRGARVLRICGDGPLYAELRSYAESKGLNEMIIFEGFLQSPELIPLLSCSIALLLPSWEEQYGNVICESLALGVPVIVSEVCGARELLVSSGETGYFFEPDNPNGLAYFMNLISTDKGRWTKLSTTARLYAAKVDAPEFAAGVAALLADS